MARTRNKILSDIVIANGGAVTDPNNRNSLLQDWLGAVSGPVFDWVLNMAGADIITLPSEIMIPTGQTLSAYFRVLDTALPRVFWSGTTIPRSYGFVSGGAVSIPEAATVKIDGFSTIIWPNDGDMHLLEVTFVQDVSLDRFAISHTGAFSLTGQIKDITLPSGEFFPVNDNAQTITGSLGTVMTLVGGTWEEYEVANV